MRNMHFMNRNKRLPDSAYSNHFRNPRPGSAARSSAARSSDARSIDARIAAMRASGMSILAIRRALGLNEAAATAAGILEPSRLTAAAKSDVPTTDAPATDAPATDADAPDGGATNAQSPGGRNGSGDLGMAEVLGAVARDSGIDRETLVAASQWRPAVRARHLVMILARELCPQASLPAIGFLLHRDRTTVLYGCRRAEVLLSRDPAFRTAYLRTRRALIQGSPASSPAGSPAGSPKVGFRG